MLTESLTWFAPSERMPEPDAEVLLYVPGARPPAWPGYWCEGLSGGMWRYADGVTVGLRVTAWAAMPTGPKQEG